MKKGTVCQYCERKKKTIIEQIKPWVRILRERKHKINKLNQGFKRALSIPRIVGRRASTP